MQMSVGSLHMVGGAHRAPLPPHIWIADPLILWLIVWHEGARTPMQDCGQDSWRGVRLRIEDPNVPLPWLTAEGPGAAQHLCPASKEVRAQ